MVGRKEISFVVQHTPWGIEWWNGGIVRMMYAERTGIFTALGVGCAPRVLVGKKQPDVHKLVSAVLGAVSNVMSDTELSPLEEQLIEDMRPVLGKVYKEEGLNDVSASAEMEHLESVQRNYERVLRIRKQRETAQRNESLVQSALKGLLDSGVSLSEVIDAAWELSDLG